MRTSISMLVMTFMLSIVGAVSAQQLGSGFTYQGTFADNGAPANGSYDFEFALYSVASGGDAAQTVSQPNVAVMGGLINTMIDFGAATYDGAVKFVEVRVRPAGSADAYVVQTPRQALTGVPYALGLPMPFQRSVHTGAEPAFQISAADGGTSIEGVNPTNSLFPAIHGLALGVGGIAVKGTATSNTGVGVTGQASNAGTGVLGTSGGGIGVNGTGSTGVRGSSNAGDGVRGLGVIGVHGVGNTGVWAEGGLLATDQISDNASCAGTGQSCQSVVTIRNAIIGNLILASSGTPSTDVFRVNGNGSVFTNGDYVAGGADVAEYVPATESLEPGDVAEIDAVNGKGLRMSSRANSAAVAGVVSTRPGLTLNGSMSEHEAQKGMPRLALVGRVPVKTTNENGAIHAGDLLVSSSRPGHAMRAPESPRAGTVIGKAMEPLEGHSGVIEMLVMLR